MSAFERQVRIPLLLAVLRLRRTAGATSAHWFGGRPLLGSLSPAVNGLVLRERRRCACTIDKCREVLSWMRYRQMCVFRHGCAVHMLHMCPCVQSRV